MGLSPSAGGGHGSLICLPYAAGGSSTFMEFAKALEKINPAVCVHAVTYPGNELDGSSRDQKDFEILMTETVEIIKSQVAPPLRYTDTAWGLILLWICAPGWKKSG